MSKKKKQEDVDKQEEVKEVILENEEDQETGVKDEKIEEEGKEEDTEEKDSTEEKDDSENLSGKYAKLEDKHLRLTAEFDNYRKRTLKEKMELVKTGGESVLINILPIIDDFERALQSIGEASDIEALKEGMDLIYSKFSSFINQNGINEIKAKEEDFDTDLHEAVAKIPAPAEELKGKVVDVIQKGYTLHEKVIRHAKVVVGE